MTSQKLNEEHEILRRFMAVVVSSAFWASLSLVTLHKCQGALQLRRLSPWAKAVPFQRVTRDKPA